jgi:hypothetical protein
MKQLMAIPLLLVAGCTQGFIGETASGPDVDGLRINALALTGSTSDARTVVVDGRADDDGADDTGFRFTWNLADCHDADCLPVDIGAARTHVFRVRATNSAGEHLYKKVTVTLYPEDAP